MRIGGVYFTRGAFVLLAGLFAWMLVTIGLTLVDVLAALALSREAHMVVPFVSGVVVAALAWFRSRHDS